MCDSVPFTALDSSFQQKIKYCMFIAFHKVSH